MNSGMAAPPIRTAGSARFFWGMTPVMAKDRAAPMAALSL